MRNGRNEDNSGFRFFRSALHIPSSELAKKQLSGGAGTPSDRLEIAPCEVRPDR